MLQRAFAIISGFAVFACLLTADLTSAELACADETPSAEAPAKKAAAKKADKAKVKAKTKPTQGLRYPSLSKDGALVTFAYRGDIWVAETAKPDQARRLTIHEAQDTLPRISPDGTTIAFASRREGAYSIYTIPVTGGVPTAVTHHSAVEIPCDWSADGKRLLFMSNRDPSRYRLNLYEIPVSGGTARRITFDGGRDGAYAPDGKHIVYARGFNTIYQDNYEGSGNYDLYVVPTQGGAPRRLTKTEGNERYPFVSPDGKTVWFVAEAKGVANVYALPFDFAAPEKAVAKRKQVTTYKGDDIHRPDLAWDGKTLSFERRGLLYTAELTKRAPKAKPLGLVVRGDVRHSGVTRRQVTSGAEHVDINREGTKLVFSAHGNIWVMPAGGGPAKRLTSHPASDQWPRWSPDGSAIVFQSDRRGNFDLYAMDPAGESKGVKRITSHPKDDHFHSWSPDGKHIVFASDRTGDRELWRMEVSSGDLLQLTKSKGPDDDPRWSPDGKRIAFDSGRDRSQAIYTMDIDGKNVLRVTRGVGFFQVPVWSPDGSMICYESIDPNRGTSRGLFVVPAMGGQSMRVSRTGSGPCWTPDGSRSSSRWVTQVPNSSIGCRHPSRSRTASAFPSSARSRWTCARNSQSSSTKRGPSSRTASTIRRCMASSGTP